MRMHLLQRATHGAQTAPGNGAVSHVAPAPVPEQAMPAPEQAMRAAPGMAAQLCAIASLLTGLWVAISPWFLTLQAQGGNATVNDLIIGLAVAGLAVFAAAGLRGTASLHTASGLAGIWLIISPFILDAKFPITAAMYWSNVWAGSIIAVLAVAALAAARPRPAR